MKLTMNKIFTYDLVRSPAFSEAKLEFNKEDLRKKKRKEREKKLKRIFKDEQLTIN